MPTFISWFHWLLPPTLSPSSEIEDGYGLGQGRMAEGRFGKKLHWGCPEWAQDFLIRTRGVWVGCWQPGWVWRNFGEWGTTKVLKTPWVVYILWIKQRDMLPFYLSFLVLVSIFHFKHCPRLSGSLYKYSDLLAGILIRRQRCRKTLKEMQQHFLVTKNCCQKLLWQFFSRANGI